MRVPWPIRRARLPVLIGLASLIIAVGALPNPQPILGAARPHHRGRAPAATRAADATPGRSATVLGFAPWWSLGSLGPGDVAGENQVAYFGLDLDRDGTLATTGPGASGLRSTAFGQLASAVRARGSTLLLSIEALAPGSASAVISDSGAPARLVSDLVPLLVRTGAGGVNLDLEGLGQSDRDALTAFVSATAAGLRRALPSVRVVVDVTADAGSPSSAYDAAALAAVADRIFVMAYDMSGASWAGPVNALPSEEADLSRIAAMVPPAKVILGVPLYARTWVTTSDAPRAPVQPSAVAVPAQPAACPSGSQQAGGEPPSGGSGGSTSPSGSTSSGGSGGSTTSSPASSSPNAGGPGTSTASPPGNPTGQSDGAGTTQPPAPGPQPPAPAQAIPYAVLAGQGSSTWWDAQAFEAWTAWPQSGHWREAYFDNPVAMQARGALAARLGLGGVGVWALGMDDDAHDLTSALLRGYSNSTPPGPPGLPGGPDSVHTSSPPPTLLIPSSNRAACQSASTSATSSTTSATSTTRPPTPTTGSGTSTTSTTQPTTSTAPAPTSATSSTTTTVAG